MITSEMVAMLDSTNLNERKEGIKLLVRSNDREALVYLADVIRYDKNEEIRELARKAGAYIRQNTHGPEKVVIEETQDDDDDTNQYPLPSEVEVSSVDIERARGYLDQAMNFNVRGNNQRAGEMMRQAFEANPRLLHDSYAVSLAAAITGMPGPQALKLLLRK